MKEKIEFVKSLLPDHYEVKESATAGSIRCISKIGIRQLPYLSKAGKLIDDAEDELAWSRFFTSLRIHFKQSFQEVYCNVCFCYTDFTIYIKHE